MKHQPNVKHVERWFEEKFPNKAELLAGKTSTLCIQSDSLRVQKYAV